MSSRKPLRRRAAARESCRRAIESQWSTGLFGNFKKVPSDPFHQLLQSNKPSVKRQVQTLKDKMKSLKKRYKYAETPHTKSVIHDIQSDDSGTYIHIPRIAGLVQPNYPGFQEGKSDKIGLRRFIYDNPVDTKRICYANRPIRSPPYPSEKLGDGSFRYFDTYMEKDFLKYSRNCVLLEHFLRSTSRRLVRLSEQGAMDRETKRIGLKSLYTVVQNYDPSLGYNQARPKTWARRSTKDYSYSNRLLQSVFKGIAACHAA